MNQSELIAAGIFLAIVLVLGIVGRYMQVGRPAPGDRSEAAPPPPGRVVDDDGPAAPGSRG